MAWWCLIVFKSIISDVGWDFLGCLLTYQKTKGHFSNTFNCFPFLFTTFSIILIFIFVCAKEKNAKTFPMS